MKPLIKKILELDSAIENNTSRIEQCNLDELNLAHALKTAQQKEKVATQKYVERPTEKTQDSLELARDFTQSCQKRVTLFKNASGPIINDNKTLWARRKTLLAQLSAIRISETRKGLTEERQALIKTLYPKIIRLILLTSHLDGLDVLHLDINRVLQKYSSSFKADLELSKTKLKEQFEALQ